MLVFVYNSICKHRSTREQFVFEWDGFKNVLMPVFNYIKKDKTSSDNDDEEEDEDEQ